MTQSNEIRTNRLLLSPFTPGDALDFFNLTQDAGFRAYAITNYQQADLESAQRWIHATTKNYRQNKMGMLSIRLISDGKLIGMCGLRPITIDGDVSSRIEITYRLRQDAWGQGFATEAAMTLLDYGFDELGLTEIIAVIAADNLPSRKLAEKIGMSFVKALVHMGVKAHLFVMHKVAA